MRHRPVNETTKLLSGWVREVSPGVGARCSQLTGDDDRSGWRGMIPLHYHKVCDTLEISNSDPLVLASYNEMATAPIDRTGLWPSSTIHFT